MKRRTLLVFFLGVIVGGAVTSFLPFGHSSVPVPVPAVRPSASVALPASLDPASLATLSPLAKPPKAPKMVVDPDARAALALVGSDPEAEQYWISAINNPDIPDKERKKLIEDLDQDGLSSRRNPTAEDAAVMVYRLQLIDRLAQNPMDQTNADAFATARQDLVKLLTPLLPPAQ